MIALLIMVVIAAFAAWDRQSPLSPSPDGRLVGVGVVLAVVGAVSSFLLWWLVVPVVLFLVGDALIVIGRHRVASTH